MPKTPVAARPAKVVPPRTGYVKVPVVTGMLAPPDKKSADPYKALATNVPLVPGMLECDPSQELDLANIPTGKVDSVIRAKLAAMAPPPQQNVAETKKLVPVAPTLPDWTSEDTHGSARETAVMVSGRELPKLTYKTGTDPLLIESLNTLETLMCGGAIAVWATRAYEDVSSLVAKLRAQICVKPSTKKK